MKKVGLVCMFLLVLNVHANANECNIKTNAGDKGLFLNSTKISYWKPWFRTNSLLNEAVEMKKTNVCDTIKIDNVDVANLDCVIEGYPNKGLSIGSSPVVSWNPATGKIGRAHV